MGLIDIDLAAMPHEEEPLLRVHVRLGRDPRGRVDRRGFVATCDVLPIDDQGDCIFGRDIH